jgi:hypothetical protein
MSIVEPAAASDETIVLDEAPSTEPTTLSGRPVVGAPSAGGRTPTRVSRGSAIAVTIFLAGVLTVAGLTFLGRGPEGTDVRQMSAGECFTETDTVVDHGRVIPFGQSAPCLASSPRVLAVIALPLGEYPEAAGLNQVVADRCGGEQTRIVAPTAESWAAGDRTVVCLAGPV